MAQNNPDPHALRIAETIHELHQPEITILYGSRARGDHQPGRSDLDIMIVQESIPPDSKKAEIRQTAESTALELYDNPPAFHFIWKTSSEFARKRRAVNHIIPNALREGIIMPRNPEEYSNRYQDDGEVDYQEEWTTTDERVRHAENHLIIFNDTIDLERHDDMIGQHAHGAMEHALKALISASGHRYERIHDINILMSDAMQADPGFDPQPLIDGSVYDQYSGSDEYYTKHRPISEIDGYRDAVINQVTSILDRVQQVKTDRQT